MENISHINASQHPSEYQSYGEIPEVTKQDRDVAILQGLISDRYHVIKKLGKGSQGAVFLAETINTHVKVAIKQLLVQSVKDWKQYDLFQREAAVLKRLDMDGVARLHETIELLDNDPPMALIVQDYIAGEPLQRFIANGHRFQISQIGDILLQLLDILDKLHHSNPPVIHRDIKPSNIILNYVENDSSLQVHLIDFGAVANPQVKGGGSTVVGTYGYMSPEQLMGNATPSSDLYSLAIVAVYLLSGVPPEELETQDFHVLIDPHLQHLPHQITGFLRKMLEPHEEERINDYGQLHEFFTALKKQQFDKIPITNSISAKDKNSMEKGKYSLNRVYSYHQQGNIVLWQELSDKTPRNLDGHVKNVFKRSIKSKNGSSIKKVFYEIFCFFAFLSISFSVVLGINQYIMYNGEHYQVYIVYGIWVLSIALAIFVWYRNKQYNSICMFSYNPEKFLINARKSMATVTRIEFKPKYLNLSEINTRYMKNESHTPTWVVTYGFNPPDDSSPDILIRTFETHVEPDFKEGDLIPILYLIEHVHNGEHVYSSPYPIPLADFFDPCED